VSTFDEKSGVGEHNRQIPFDAHCIRLGDAAAIVLALERGNLAKWGDQPPVPGRQGIRPVALPSGFATHLVAFSTTIG
jgi:hypothetical protein